MSWFSIMSLLAQWIPSPLAAPHYSLEVRSSEQKDFCSISFLFLCSRCFVSLKTLVSGLCPSIILTVVQVLGVSRYADSPSSWLAGQNSLIPLGDSIVPVNLRTEQEGSLYCTSLFPALRQGSLQLFWALLQALKALTYNDPKLEMTQGGPWRASQGPTVTNTGSGICSSPSAAGSARQLWHPGMRASLAPQSSCCLIHSPALPRVVKCWTTCSPLALKLRGSSAESPSNSSDAVTWLQKNSLQALHKKTEKQTEGSCS